jgi:membrane associated rhomboid family serine protease
MLALIALAIVGGLVWKILSTNERAWLARLVRFVFRATIFFVREYKQEELAPFRETLRARVRWPIATACIVALNAGLYVWMRLHGGGTDAASLVGWGASLGTRTTNGEWWRLVTALFVNAGLVGLVIKTAAVCQVGLTLERVAGPLAFLVAYVAGGITLGLWNLRAEPVSVTTSSVGAVFAVYGLLGAVTAVGWRWRSAVTVPRAALERNAPVAMLFALWALFTGAWTTGALASLAVGLVFGAVAARDVAERVPPPRRVVAIAATGLAMAVVAAIFVRGITDVRPEIARLVAVEQRTADAYEAALEQFRRGRIGSGDLADLIDRDILPELETADARLSALSGVPPSDAWRVSDAREYVRLRSESWALRAAGLRGAGQAPEVEDVANGADRRAQASAQHRTTTRTLARAETSERDSLAALERIQEP